MPLASKSKIAKKKKKSGGSIGVGWNGPFYVMATVVVHVKICKIIAFRNYFQSFLKAIPIKNPAF